MNIFGKKKEPSKCEELKLCLKQYLYNKRMTEKSYIIKDYTSKIVKCCELEYYENRIKDANHDYNNYLTLWGYYLKRLMDIIPHGVTIEDISIDGTLYKVTHESSTIVVYKYQKNSKAENGIVWEWKEVI